MKFVYVNLLPNKFVSLSVVTASLFGANITSISAFGAPEKAKTGDHPTLQNGNWDWEKSPDVKSGVVSPLLLHYLRTVQEFYDRAGSACQLSKTDAFVVDGYRSTRYVSSFSPSHVARIGIFIAGACYLNQNNPKRDYFFDYPKGQTRNNTYNAIAVEAAKTLLDKRATDPKMKELCAMVILDYSMYTVNTQKGYQGYGEGAKYIAAKNNTELKEELLREALSTGTGVWVDLKKYTRDARIGVTKGICLGVNDKFKNDFDGLIDYYGESNSVSSRILASVLQQGLNKLKEKDEAPKRK